jgi:UDP-GlcNAc:undecaprenyl-phosphate GlcNAc-1-phosphate transferase
VPVVVGLAGALAGFLVYNLPPARIFLGDSGSMLIGLVIGAVAIEGSFKAPATAALAAPVLVLALPIFDGVAAVIRRRLTGSAVSVPDRGHIHHCLQRRGWSNRQVLAGVATLCGFSGLTALVSLYFRSDPLALLAVTAIVFGCVVTKVFGHYEYRLLLGQPVSLWVGLGLRPPLVLALCHRLRRCRSVVEAWSALIESAGRLRLRAVEIRLTRPDLLFEGQWEAPGPQPELPRWQVALPLLADRKELGQLTLSGYSQGPVWSQVLGMRVVARALASACDRLGVANGSYVLALSSADLKVSPGQPRLGALRMEERIPA